MSLRIMVIADVAGSGHFYHAGDEAMAEVALERLKNIVGSNNLVLACPHPWTAGPVYGVKSIAMPLRSGKTWLLHLLINPIGTTFRFARAFWHLTRSELVFKAGGGNMVGENGKFPLLTAAHWARKKIVLVSQTIGPLKEPYRSDLRRQLQDAVWIGVRDRCFSGRQLGLPVHPTVDDAVFLEPKHNSLTSQLVRDNTSMVGISLQHVKGVDPRDVEALLDSMEDVVAGLKSTALFIPHHAPRGGKDLALARSVAAKWNKARSRIIDRVLPAKSIMALTGSLHLVLASRYHAVVFGLARGIPTIAFYHNEYTEAKMRGVYEIFGLQPWVLSISEAAQKLPEMVGQALTAREEFSVASRRTQVNELDANMAPYKLISTLVESQEISRRNSLW